MFAETEILPDDCLPHESNGTLSGPQSGGTMRHKIDVLFDMQRRKVATTSQQPSTQGRRKLGSKTRSDAMKSGQKMLGEWQKKTRRFNVASRRIFLNESCCFTPRGMWTYLK